jgi:conjugative relaxase-like TrwC/TraI family protein
MQTTHKISGDAAAGFAAYLTAGSTRGDYYVGGEANGELGEWHGSDDALRELGLSHDRAVERDQLLALMNGRSPVTGEPIRPVGGDRSRVAGIDLTFSAPKSVSALWAVSGPYRRAQIEAAHRKAVASTQARIERDVEPVRRRERGVLRWERAKSLVAAEFVHTSSRLTRDQESDGVADPQLHSHLVVLAAERLDGSFAAVDSRELMRSARENGAWYRAELAFELGELGLEVEGRTGRDGRFFELRGVPPELSRRWSSRTEEIERAASRFRDRHGRAPRAGELAGMTISTRGTKTVLAQVDVDEAWRAVGEEYGLNHARAEDLFASRGRHRDRDVELELLGALVSERSLVTSHEVRARAFEVAAGVERPRQTLGRINRLACSGELIALEDGYWTTRALRDLERRTLDRVSERTRERTGVSEESRYQAVGGAYARLGSPLTREQRHALETLTGDGGVAVLVGQAGTGKGAVLAAARDAYERDGHRVIGTAVAGATAKRLESDAGFRESVTVDALLHRHRSGQLDLDYRTVIVLDEAGMADTQRLAQLVDVADESRSKLILAGDAAQLGPIGAGGLFSEIAARVPSAELTEVHRASHEWERDAWQQVHSGEAERALAQYQARGRLHVSETRVDAGERMVTDWAQQRVQRPSERVVMFTDASNDELDRLNKLAQQHRAQIGELGQHCAQLPGRPYQLAAGDEILLNAQLPVAGGERVENGTRAQVMRVDPDTDRVLIRTEGARARDVEFSTRDFSGVRLAYAQHVYKAQGATVDRSLVLIGGWQTDRERTYVALTRAREQTDIYVAQDDLATDGVDHDLIKRLSERMSHSRAQQPSVTRDAISNTRESEVGRILRERRERQRDRGHGIDLW